MTVIISAGRTTRDEVRVTINGKMHILDLDDAARLIRAVDRVATEIVTDQRARGIS